MEIEVKIRALMMDPNSGTPIIILKDIESDTMLPIWVGAYEANAIALEIEKIAPPRPMTHDLLRNLIIELGMQVERVVVTSLRDNTFFAVIEMRTSDGSTMVLDSRPSDAIALAVRCDAQIFAADDVIEESAIEFQAEDEEQPGLVTMSSLADLDPAEFRKFLETVTVEQFASSLLEGEEEEPDEAEPEDTDLEDTELEEDDAS